MTSKALVWLNSNKVQIGDRVLLLPDVLKDNPTEELAGHAVVITGLIPTKDYKTAYVEVGKRLPIGVIGYCQPNYYRLLKATHYKVKQTGTKWPKSTNWHKITDFFVMLKGWEYQFAIKEDGYMIPLQTRKWWRL